MKRIYRDAVISDDGLYRYRLTRRWDGDLFGDQARHMVWVMLNPSTADAEADDPTIRRCMGFAQRCGFVGMHVVNLYAWRAANPQELGRVADPVGPDNDRWILDTIRGASVIGAWGGGAQRTRVARFAQLATPSLVLGVWCLGTTQTGMPRHPLYVPGSTAFEPWEMP